MSSRAFLLDTHALLWWLFDDGRLSPLAREILQDPYQTILVSSASAWEIAKKHRLGKLASAAVLVQDIPRYIGAAGFDALPISLRHAQHAESWPQAHRDPFDRMLAAQAFIEPATLVTRDSVFQTFGIETFW